MFSIVVVVVVDDLLRMNGEAILAGFSPFAIWHGFFFRIEVVKYPNTFLLEKKVEQGHFVCKLKCMLNFVHDFYK